MSRHDRSLKTVAPAPLPLRPQDETARAPEPETPAQAAPPQETQDRAPEAPKKGGKKKKAVLGLIAAAVLAAGAYEGHHYWTVGRFMVETDDAYVNADITLISSRVQGYVSEVPVQANQHVKAGEVLIRLEDGDYRNALDTAQSRYETAGDTLARIDAQIEAAEAAVTQAEAGRDAAEAQLQNATTSADRVRNLTERKVAAQAQLDSATEALATATANVAQAEAAIASATAQVDVLRAQKAEAEGQRHELELAVEQAKRNLDRTVLRAPADGTLAALQLEKGDLVAPGTRLAALVPDSGLYVEANYKETQLPGIEPGATVHLTFDALPDRTFEGHVQSVAPATGSVFSLLPADNATGNFTKVVQRVPVRIALPPEAVETGKLRAGLSVIAEVDSRTADGETPTAVAALSE
ncbi:HlyD family secretion protein [Oceaniglobus roseus]|uniref:HlyD family secretion protein n=1 Tax=Oceaniglobus roseus TaxID=1737570 RepID=UPI000C7EC187|nr:HlyD family secretion protein [Kandeliimicrobium roseum]